MTDIRKRSSFCAARECVRVTFIGRAAVAVSDGTAEVRFTLAEWAAFTDGVKAGEFDVPSLAAP